jgi:Zn-dependent protease/CBS domain-containing protein
MSWSITLGRIFGVQIKVHLTFFFILVWGAFSFGGSAGPWYGLLVTVALFTLVLLHELGHSLAAKGYGIPVNDITLLPIGGVARLARMPEKPIQELVVALAGPAVNVVLGMALLPIVLALAVSQGATLSLGMWSQPGVLGLLTFLLSANLSLAAFNLIPAFPMDGGRVFRALLGTFLDYQRATSLAVGLGRFLAIGFGVFGLLTGQFFLAFIALFIFTASGQEGAAVAARSVLRNVRVGQTLAQNTATLSPGTTVGQAASLAASGHRPDFAVLDPHSRRLLGVVSRADLARAVERGQWYRGVTEMMQPVQNVPSVTLNTTLAEVQERLAQASGRVAAVYDGQLFQGLISLDDVRRAFYFLSRGASTTRRPAWEISS